MVGELPRMKFSNQPVICKKCGEEVRGKEMERHTLLTGHDDFYVRPGSIPATKEQ
jgi:hypothetical protein